MTEDVVIDLKQFITATISQQTIELGRRIDGVELRLDGVEQRLGNVEYRLDGVEHRLGSVENRIDVMEEKLDGLTGFVVEAIDTSNETSGKQLKDHEVRITKLEQKSVA